MSRGPKRVLIVEDDLSLRPLWESFFRSHSEKVWLDWAVSCEQALVMIEQKNKERKKYSLIISDVFLAGSGTGMDLIKSREVRDSGAKTVLVSSADCVEMEQQFGHLFPQTEIISKPLDFEKYERVLMSTGAA